MTLSVFFKILKLQEMMDSNRGMRELSKSQLFAIDFNILNLLGSWPGNLINLRFAAILTSSFFLELIPEVFFIYENRNDVLKIFMCLHEFVTVIIYVIKMTIMLIKRKKIMKLVNELKKIWAESIAHKIIEI